MPIAINGIEEKLKRGEFPTLTSLESYFKRMVANAKDYNEKESLIHQDAERIRKALSNYMTKHNPAYQIQGYQAVPTPIPEHLLAGTDEDDLGSDIDAEGEIDDEAEAQSSPEPEKRRPGRPSKNSSSVGTNGQRSGSTPARSDSQYAGLPFSSLNFREAQEKILADLLAHKADE
jgi:hypothetical protein